MSKCDRCVNHKEVYEPSETINGFRTEVPIDCACYADMDNAKSLHERICRNGLLAICTQFEEVKNGKRL